MKPSLLCSTISALVAGALHAQPTPLTHLPDWYVANNAVQAITPDEATGVVYVGGTFSELQPPVPTGYGCALEDGEGWPILNQVRANGVVRAVVPDGTGGWFIGGEFTQVNSQPRLRLAHILSNGTLDINWASGAEGIVRALALDNGVLYVGGDFPGAGGQPKPRIAAFYVGGPNNSQLVNGFVDNVNHANNNGQVRSIVVHNGLVYVGGTFTNMGGATCSRLIALDPATGAAAIPSWQPNMSSDVNTIAINGTTAFVGGNFTTVNTIARQRIAELDLANAALTPWVPGTVNGEVSALAISGDTLFAGGNFTTFTTGNTRTRLAAMKLDGTYTVLPWNPTAGGQVYTLLVDGPVVRFGGSYTAAGTNVPAVARGRLAAVDRVNGAATEWNPYASSTVYALAKQGGLFYAGGAFDRIGIRPRGGVASIDMATGRPTTWNPNANNSVNAIKKAGDVVYIGGAFTTVGGVARNRIAAIDAAGAALAGWAPSSNNTVLSMAVSGGNLYLGGLFTTISGYTRNRLAAIAIANGAVDPNWDPNADGTVYTIEENNGALYVGGDFQNIGTPAQPRLRLARLSTSSSTPDSWNPGASGSVRALAFKTNEGKVYVGGFFNNVGGSPRNYLAALDVSTGTALSGWVCNANNSVTALACHGNTLYVGGYFAGNNSLGGAARNRFASVHATLGTVFPVWNTSVDNGYINAFARSGDLLLAGGTFYTLNGVSRNFLSAWEVQYEDESTGTDAAAATGADDALLVFPNPTHGPLTVRLADARPVDRIRVVNATGQLVKDLRPGPGALTGIDLTNLASGLHTVIVTQGARTTTRQVVVQQ
jgi:hypothetical protein